VVHDLGIKLKLEKQGCQEGSHPRTQKRKKIEGKEMGGGGVSSLEKKPKPRQDVTQGIWLAPEGNRKTGSRCGRLLLMGK